MCLQKKAFELRSFCGKLFWLTSDLSASSATQKTAMSQGVYPQNWKQMATAIKAASNWRCTKCGRVCLRPGEKPPDLTLSQRKAYTLQVHHWNYDPSDNRPENLVCLCSGCHLYYHRFGRGNISPGQLSLFAELKVS